jgi:hypothetical protein
VPLFSFGKTQIINAARQQQAGLKPGDYILYHYL